MPVNLLWPLRLADELRSKVLAQRDP